MTIYLRQSTASQEVPLGHFVDSTDGVTAETGLSIANTDIKLWKTGATTLANKNSGGATHISGGIYYAVLDATDTDTIGPMVIFIAVSGALAVRLQCVVLDEAMYDWTFGTSAPGTLDAAGVRAAVGLASANLDTQLGAIDDYIDTEVAAIKAKTDLIPGTVDGKTFIQGWGLVMAALLGKMSGGGSTTVTFRAVNDTADRIVATVDANGNRLATTLTP